MIKEFCKRLDGRYTITYETQTSKIYIYDEVEHKRLGNKEVFDFVGDLIINNVVLAKEMTERYLQENTRANRFYVKNIELQKQNQNLRIKKNTIVDKIFKALLTYGIKDKYYSSEDVYFCIRNSYLEEIEQECMNDTNI